MLHFRYHNANCFFVRSSGTQQLLAVDAGWPGTLFEYTRMMKTIGSRLMEKIIEKSTKGYRRIEREKLRRITTEESQEYLRRIGIRGRVILTVYHSRDSVTFISEDGEAIIGDLPPQGQMMSDDVRFSQTWEVVRKMGGRLILPGHAEGCQIANSEIAIRTEDPA